MRTLKATKEENRPGYNTLGTYLKERFGERAYKVPLDMGLTCPNRDSKIATGGCTYCNPVALKQGWLTPGMTIPAQLDYGIEAVKRRYGKNAKRFLAYFQANSSTYAPLDELRARYEEALTHPLVDGWAISTRPDLLDDDVLSLINELHDKYGKKEFWLELGLQSANDATLKKINRGHSAADFINAVERAAKLDVKVCAHIILGLPGEDREDILKTIDLLNSLPIWGVKFHQLQVVTGTMMEEDFKRGDIKTLGLDEYSTLVIECLERLRPDIIIHRLVGDTLPGMHLAPKWGPDRRKVIEKMPSLLVAKDTYQGKLYKATP